MPTINMASIMKKVDAYSKSNEGKIRMKNCIKNYSDNGITKTEAGDRIMSEKDMHLAAAKMIDVLIKTARSYDLPASIMEHFEGLSASKIYEMPDGSSTIYIYFGGDLHRESLYSEGYDGVDNIIAVLNNGYNAKGYVYGWWEGHEPTEDNAYRSGWTGSGSTDAYIRSRKDREGLQFIQQAVQDFNGNYGSDYNVVAIAGDDYQ